MAEHLRPRFFPTTETTTEVNQQVTPQTPTNSGTEQVTEQVPAPATEQVAQLVQLSHVQLTIVQHADTPRTLAELMEITGYKQRPYFKIHHLEPLLAGKVLRMTVPDKPTSSKQQYVLTETGVKLKAMHGQAGVATEQEPEQ